MDALHSKQDVLNLNSLLKMQFRLTRTVSDGQWQKFSSLHLQLAISVYATYIRSFYYYSLFATSFGLTDPL
jgi:hypothetical protein